MITFISLVCLNIESRAALAIIAKVKTFQVNQTLTVRTLLHSVLLSNNVTRLSNIFDQVEVSFNINDDDQKNSFLLAVTLTRETINDFDVMVCAR